MKKWSFFSISTSSWAHHYRALLKTCAQHSLLESGQQLHAAVTTAGLLPIPTLYLPNAVLHMYAACGHALSARKVFDEIPVSYKHTANWTALMDCYTGVGLPIDGLELFPIMRRLGVPVDEVTMVSVLSTCAKVGNSVVGIQVHGCTIKLGFDSFVKTCNAAMDMYIKCGFFRDGQVMFYENSSRNVVSWTILLSGMVKFEGVEQGRKVFDEMPERNELAWKIMVAKYIENGLIDAAFRLLTEMMFDYRLPLSSTSLCTLLSACAQSGDVTIGKWLHLYAVKATANDVRLGTALLDMYAKCRRINTAMRIFKSMKTRNVVTWNAILGGLAMHGKGSTVLEMFDQMEEEGIKPDNITFTAVLSACSHSGLVHQGRNFFHALEKAYATVPSMDNYASMVDLLGRSGHLQEAEAIMHRMPMKPNEVILGSLLGACSVHGHHQLAERLIHNLQQMYPDNTEHHVLLANMYTRLGKSNRADSFRKDLKAKGIRKFPGMSTIYINGRIHQFSAGEKSHPQVVEIYAKLEEIIRKLKLDGYIPDVASQIFPGGGAEEEEEEKEGSVVCHSEKLAVSFGLMSTKEGMPLYILKNLRICQDCHAAMKLVSKVYNREIVIRDRNRFHSFKHGLCSCSDYW